jgi:cytoskeletal protein CcmA (bactofilin family)
VWNRRKDEEPLKPSVPPSPPAAAFKPIEPIQKEPTPVSSTPTGRFEPESRGASANIGKAVKIVGQIFTKEDLYIDGEVEGTVEGLESKLTIGPHGVVKSGIRVREVVVIGGVQGNVEASEKIEIRKEARLVGDIKTARIIIEDGAYFKGSIDIIKPEPPKPPQRPPQISQPAPGAGSAPTQANLTGIPEKK